MGLGRQPHFNSVMFSAETIDAANTAEHSSLRSIFEGPPSYSMLSQKSKSTLDDIVETAYQGKNLWSTRGKSYLPTVESTFVNVCPELDKVKRGLDSPDDADALALTFAQVVAPRRVEAPLPRPGVVGREAPDRKVSNATQSGVRLRGC